MRALPYFIWARAHCGTCGWDLFVLESKMEGEGLLRRQTQLVRCDNPGCAAFQTVLRIHGPAVEVGEVVISGPPPKPPEDFQITSDISGKK